MKAIHGFVMAVIVADIAFAYMYFDHQVSELSSYLMVALNVLFFIYVYVLDKYKIKLFDFEKKLEDLEREHKTKR
jgi:Ca2+/Na+ antiporter